jgi:hypothetical protein
MPFEARGVPDSGSGKPAIQPFSKSDSGSSFYILGNPDSVSQYFDFPIFHAQTGSSSSIPSPVGIRLRSVSVSGRMQLEI